MRSKLIVLSTLLVLVTLFSMTTAVYADNNSQPSMVGSQWAVYEQTTLASGSLLFYPAAQATTIPTGGVQFSMPDATGSSPAFVNYLLDTYTASLTTSNTLSAAINVVATSGSPAFLGDTFGGYNLATPAFVRLFIQSNLPASNAPNCLGSGGHNVNNYWWADYSSYTFPSSPSSLSGSTGAIQLSAALNPSAWSNICGQSGSSDPAVFSSALANIKYVGLSFGSGYFFASGVGVDGTTGAAAFQLLSYTIS